MKKYYAVCDVNGPISVAIDAEDTAAALAIFEAADKQAWIDGPRTDAEDDLGIGGADTMPEEEFEAALIEAGCTPLQNLDVIENWQAGTQGRLSGGWFLYLGPYEEESE